MEIIEYKIIQNNEFHPELFKTNKINIKTDLSLYENIYDILCKMFLLDKLAEEYVYVLAMDYKLNSKGIFQLSHGTSKESNIRNKELFTFLLLSGADQFIVAHNHVNGSLEISTNDIIVTKKMETCAALLGIEFLNHMIISNKGYKLINDETEGNEMLPFSL